MKPRIYHCMEGQFDEVTLRMVAVRVQRGIFEVGEMTGENGVVKILLRKD